jgi:hypothetical protein
MGIVTLKAKPWPALPSAKSYGHGATVLLFMQHHDARTSRQPMRYHFRLPVGKSCLVITGIIAAR